MAVVTISREFGSEGTAIAEKAAQALGYHLADKNTIETILKEYGIQEFDRMYDSIPGFWDRFDAQRMELRGILITMLNQTLRALAQHGNMVILGRGGFAVLAGLVDVLHVRIQAPLPLRVRRAAEQPAIAEPSRAELLVKENDRIQKGFVESVYGTSWDSVKGFDLGDRHGQGGPGPGGLLDRGGGPVDPGPRDQRDPHRRPPGGGPYPGCHGEGVLQLHPGARVGSSRRSPALWRPSSRSCITATASAGGTGFGPRPRRASRRAA